MTRIAKRQVYVAADPRSSTILQITSYTPGDTHAAVTDTHGRRRRDIRVIHLHPTWYTASGGLRRTGYIFDEDATEAAEEAWQAEDPHGAYSAPDYTRRTYEETR